jgi:hypothetical protein
MKRKLTGEIRKYPAEAVLPSGMRVKFIAQARNLTSARAVATEYAGIAFGVPGRLIGRER